MPENLSPSPVVNTEAICWTSSWTSHRNQNIIPLLQTTAKGAKQSNRRPEAQSWYLKARWQLRLLLSEHAAGWAALPRWQYSCKPKHAGEEGWPQDSPCVHACMHVKASTTRASLKGCSSATSCAHKHARMGSCWWLHKKPLHVQYLTACVKSSRKIHWHGMWSPLGASTFLHVSPWQWRYAMELLQKPISLPSFH